MTVGELKNILYQFPNNKEVKIYIDRIAGKDGKYIDACTSPCYVEYTDSGFVVIEGVKNPMIY